MHYFTQHLYFYFDIVILKMLNFNEIFHNYYFKINLTKILYHLRNLNLREYPAFDTDLLGISPVLFKKWLNNNDIIFLKMPFTFAL